MKKLVLGFIFLLGLILIGCGVYLYLNSNQKIMISFDPDNSTKIDALVIMKGEKINLPKVEKEGYVLDGWYNDNEKVTNDTMYHKDILLKAKWTEKVKTTFTVTFDSDGGSPVESIVLECGKELVLPTNPIKEGYNFVSWTDKNERPILNNALLACEDVTLKANWSK